MQHFTQRGTKLNSTRTNNLARVTARRTYLPIVQMSDLRAQATGAGLAARIGALLLTPQLSSLFC